MLKKRNNDIKSLYSRYISIKFIICLYSKCIICCDSKVCKEKEKEVDKEKVFVGKQKY